MTAPHPDRRRQTGHRPLEEIADELTHHSEIIREYSPAIVKARQSVAALRALADEYEAALIASGTPAPVQPAALAETIVSLKEAARQTGWKVKRIKAAILRRAAQSGLPPLGYQAGELRNSPWNVYLDALRAYIAGAESARREAAEGN